MAKKDDDVLSEMAQNSYGYGRWDAPYWFIGPEPGQERGENGDLTRRLRAWEALGRQQLCDCAQFHTDIERQRWHREGKLQPTWRRLILVLMVFLGKPGDREDVRAYQRTRWGSLGGETCVIELLGLAANNLSVERDRRSFVPDRIQLIRDKIRIHQPRFVLMYGIGRKTKWEEIAGCPLTPGEVLVRDGIALVMVAHPVSRGVTDDYWRAVGINLRKHVSESP